MTCDVEFLHPGRFYTRMLLKKGLYEFCLSTNTILEIPRVYFSFIIRG